MALNFHQFTHHLLDMALLYIFPSTSIIWSIDEKLGMKLEAQT